MKMRRAWILDFPSDEDHTGHAVGKVLASIEIKRYFLLLFKTFLSFHCSLLRVSMRCLMLCGCVPHQQ